MDPASLRAGVVITLCACLFQLLLAPHAIPAALSLLPPLAAPAHAHAPAMPSRSRSPGSRASARRAATVVEAADGEAVGYDASGVEARAGQPTDASARAHASDHGIESDVESGLASDVESAHAERGHPETAHAGFVFGELELEPADVLRRDSGRHHLAALRCGDALPPESVRRRHTHTHTHKERSDEND